MFNQSTWPKRGIWFRPRSTFRPTSKVRPGKTKNAYQDTSLLQGQTSEGEAARTQKDRSGRWKG